MIEIKKRKTESFPNKITQCGRWDLNPHGIATTRSLVLLVCQFRHFRISSRDDRYIITNPNNSVNIFCLSFGILYQPSFNTFCRSTQLTISNK